MSGETPGVSGQSPQSTPTSLPNITISKPSLFGEREISIQGQSATQLKIEDFIENFTDVVDQSISNRDMTVRRDLYATLKQAKEVDMKSRNFVLDFLGMYSKIDRKWKEVESKLDSYGICELVHLCDKRAVSESGLYFRGATDGKKYEATFDQLYKTLEQRIDHAKNPNELKELQNAFHHLNRLEGTRHKVSLREKGAIKSTQTQIKQKLAATKERLRDELYTSPAANAFKILDELNHRNITRPIGKPRSIIASWRPSEGDYKIKTNFLDMLDLLSNQIDNVPLEGLGMLSTALEKLALLEQNNRRDVSDKEIQDIEAKINTIREKIAHKTEEKAAIRAIFENKPELKDGRLQVDVGTKKVNVTTSQLYGDIYSRMNANPSLKDLKQIRNDLMYVEKLQGRHASSYLTHRIDALIIARSCEQTKTIIDKQDITVINSQPRKIKVDLDGMEYTTDFDTLINACDEQIEAIKNTQYPTLPFARIESLLQGLEKAEKASLRPNPARAKEIAALLQRIPK